MGGFLECSLSWWTHNPRRERGLFSFVLRLNRVNPFCNLAYCTLGPEADGWNLSALSLGAALPPTGHLERPQCELSCCTLLDGSAQGQLLVPSKEETQVPVSPVEAAERMGGTMAGIACPL